MTISNKAMREVAGHSRMLWFLPAFALVLGFVVLVESGMTHPDLFIMGFWGTVAALFLGASILVAVYRNEDRKFLRDLPAAIAHPPLSRDPRLARFEIEVSLVLLQFSFTTPFRHIDDPRRARDKFAAIALTFLLGWWSFGGLFRTPAVLYRNFRGGGVQSAHEVLEALRKVAN